MRLTLLCFTLLALGVAGCGPSGGPAAVEIRAEKSEPTGPATTELPQVANPEYTNWNRFPVGTEVKRKDVTTNGETTVTSVKSMKLTERTDEQVTIEWHVTTERSDGFKAVNPPNHTVHKKSFGLPSGMRADDFAKPSPNAKQTGTEKVSVLGKSYDARVFEWKNSTEGGEMLVKAWFADAFPGRILRQEMKVPALRRTTTEEVVEVTLPDAPEPAK